jgi:hypothetical protein
MHLVRTVKRRLHRDIVADPVLHARVLNLYLSGEAYPHTVDDYFPVDSVACPDLAAAMAEHFRDENKHVALYTKAIEKLGQAVVDLPPEHIFNHVIRSHTVQPWRVEDGLSRDALDDRIAQFLAHAHWLERRIEHSLGIHAEACLHSPCGYTHKAVAAVLNDETRHVRYTRDAVFDLVPRQRAQDILEHHRQAEHRANLDFSSRQLQRLLREESGRWSAGGRALYGSCAAALRGLLYLA